MTNKNSNYNLSGRNSHLYVRIAMDSFSVKNLEKQGDKWYNDKLVNCD